MKLKNTKYKILLLNIRSYFNQSKNYILKARNEIKIINFENNDLVVKSFKIPNIINKIAYTFFRDSKAKKSYENSVRISQFVPNPIGYIEFKKFGLIHDSYFISEKFDYDFTIRELLFDDEFKDKKLILELFAKFTSELHFNNIYHLDYSPGNILIKESDGEYIFKIVDVNRMRFINLDMDTRAKNFSRIWFNDDDLTYVVKEYIRINNIEDVLFLDRALYYSRKHKEKTELKKRIKRK